MPGPWRRGASVSTSTSSIGSASEGELLHRALVVRVEPEGPPSLAVVRVVLVRVESCSFHRRYPATPPMRVAVSYLAYSVSLRSFDFSTSRGGFWLSADSMTAHHPNPRDSPGALLAEHGDGDGRFSTSLRPSRTAPSHTPIRVPTPFPDREPRLRPEYSLVSAQRPPPAAPVDGVNLLVYLDTDRGRPDPTAAPFALCVSLNSVAVVSQDESATSPVPPHATTRTHPQWSTYLHNSTPTCLPLTQTGGYMACTAICYRWPRCEHQPIPSLFSSSKSTIRRGVQKCHPRQLHLP
jgi:hypothetical protein